MPEWVGSGIVGAIIAVYLARKTMARYFPAHMLTCAVLGFLLLGGCAALAG
jgi:hypothetical protein